MEVDEQGSCEKGHHTTPASFSSSPSPLKPLVHYSVACGCFFGLVLSHLKSQLSVKLFVLFNQFFAIFTFSFFCILFFLLCKDRFLGQVMNLYIAVAEAKKEKEVVKVLTEVRDSSTTIDKFMKSFEYKDSKFKTMCHKDFWTSQIMFRLNQDG